MAGWDTLGYSREEAPIVTMNSVIFNRLPLAKDVKREEIGASYQASDETETGRLFGFRF